MSRRGPHTEPNLIRLSSSSARSHSCRSPHNFLQQSIPQSAPPGPAAAARLLDEVAAPARLPGPAAAAGLHGEVAAPACLPGPVAAARLPRPTVAARLLGEVATSARLLGEAAAPPSRPTASLILHPSPVNGGSAAPSSVRSGVLSLLLCFFLDLEQFFESFEAEFPPFDVIRHNQCSNFFLHEVQILRSFVAEIILVFITKRCKSLDVCSKQNLLSCDSA